jgi:ATP-binding cassette subfamily B protein RaxB
MPRILVLDEATSHLDLRNEQLVNHAIRNIGQITRVIVAHRPETINMAERVIVLHQGKVVRDLAQTLTKSVEPVSPVALNALNE